MNSANTFRDPKAAPVESRPKSHLGALAIWASALIGPVPFVLAPILAGLSRIESLPVYIFCLCAWTAALLVYVSVVRSRWNRIWLFPRTRTSRILAVAGIVCHVCALSLWSLPTAVLGWVLLSGAWLSTHAGDKHDGPWKLLSHWPSLCMLLQMPYFTVTKLDQAYRQVLSQTLTYCLDLLGVPFRREQLQFEFATFALSVDDILINSPFIALLLFASCLVFSWLRRPMVLLPAYLGAAILWAFGMHLVQLCTIGFMRHAYAIDIGTGWLFVLLNVTTLLAAIGLILSTDRCLRILFMPVPLEDSSNESLNPLSRAWNRMLLPLATDN